MLDEALGFPFDEGAWKMVTPFSRQGSGRAIPGKDQDVQVTINKRFAFFFFKEPRADPFTPLPLTHRADNEKETHNL